MKLTFLGAAAGVTGSSNFAETKNLSTLVDFGISRSGSGVDGTAEARIFGTPGARQRLYYWRLGNQTQRQS